MAKLPYTINDMQNAVTSKHVFWREHALEKMTERGIRKFEVKECIHKGEIIEKYYSDKPFPSCLVFAYTHSGRPIHTVCSFNDGLLYIITAYEPNLFKWHDNYKTRRTSL